MRTNVSESRTTSDDSLGRAGEALERGAWQEARDLFEALLSKRETPEALEGLGLAASWLADIETSDKARERAYRLYRERGDRMQAGGVALSIAMTHIGFLGEPQSVEGRVMELGIEVASLLKSGPFACRRGIASAVSIRYTSRTLIDDLVKAVFIMYSWAH